MTSEKILVKFCSSLFETKLKYFNLFPGRTIMICVFMLKNVNQFGNLHLKLLHTRLERNGIDRKQIFSVD